MALRLCLVIVISTCLQWVIAQPAGSGSGITTGDMGYTYLGPGTAPNTARYQLALYTSCDCSSTRFPDYNPGRALFAIWSNNYTNVIVEERVPPDSTIRFTYTPTNTCLSYREPKCMETKRFRTIVELPIIRSDYIITSNVIDRREKNVMNIDFSYSNLGSVLTTTIPGTDKMGVGNFNSSPRYTYPVEQDVCVSTSFFRDFSDIDPDGDILNYHFSGLNRYDIATTPYPLPPPYLPVTFLYPMTAEEPMGSNVILNETTGVVSGIAPSFGYYRVGVEVSEFRNGYLISQHTKESLVYVNYCKNAKAVLKPEYNQCKSFTYQFKNEYTNTLPVTYHWDFGVPGKSNDTSNLATPAYTYPDTGVYQLTLKIANGSCVDSATARVKVYPGFYPGFIAKIACANLPVQFIDTSKTKYGSINSWSWDFGVANILLDTSTKQNPDYLYGIPSIYKVQQTVTNSFGCRETISQDITAYSHLFLQASKDTTICGLDTIALHVTNGIGKIEWTPQYEITGGNTDHPLVSPDTSTLYKVLVTAGPGCTAEDSVRVNAVTKMGIKASPERQVCRGDLIKLTAASDGNYQYRWLPTRFVQSGANTTDMVTRPEVNIVYTITGSFGSCKASDSTSINVFDYPSGSVYGDTLICEGKSATLGVNGNADTYTWSPTVGLNDIHAAKQSISPASSIGYTVILKNLTGCTKPVTKRISLVVTHPVNAFAGNDTAVAVGQILQLHASGGSHYEWAPAIGLSSTAIPNPVSVLQNDISYRLKATDSNGCIGYDNIAVRVFKTGYDIFVPSGFTPNGDGLNDVFKPLPVGISSLYKLWIFDRWGTLVFSSTQPNKGWDGKYNGNVSPGGTYIWQIRGKAVDGKMIEKKGSVLLIK